MEKEKNRINCEFGDYVACEQLNCNKPATYTYRSQEEGRVYHFCKEHYSDVADGDDDE